LKKKKGGKRVLVQNERGTYLKKLEESKRGAVHESERLVGTQKNGGGGGKSYSNANTTRMLEV